MITHARHGLPLNASMRRLRSEPRPAPRADRPTAPPELEASRLPRQRTLIPHAEAERGQESEATTASHLPASRQRTGRLVSHHFSTASNVASAPRRRSALTWPPRWRRLDDRTPKREGVRGYRRSSRLASAGAGPARRRRTDYAARTTQSPKSISTGTPELILGFEFLFVWTSSRSALHTVS
jgi:hypothetical protein